MLTPRKPCFQFPRHTGHKARSARVLRRAIANSLVETLEPRTLLSASLPPVPLFARSALHAAILQSSLAHPAAAPQDGGTVSPAIDIPPTITSADHASIFAGIGGTFTVVSQSTPVASWMETSALPSGVTFVDNNDGTATFTVTPAAAAATLNVSVTAQNGNAFTTQPFTLTILQTNSITVTTLADAGAGSLRDVINMANQSGGENLIKFSSGLKGTVSLKTQLPAIASNTILVGTGITINGKKAAATVFNINAGFTCEFLNMTITGGVGASGGGITNGGTLSVVDSTITGNTAFRGGAIFSAGNLTVIDSNISGNHATVAGGGGIFSAGNATIIDSTISSNSGGAGQDSGGGGIASQGSGFLTVTNSTIANNTADFAAGISNFDSALTLTDCTIVQNTTISDQGGVNTFSNTPATINGTIIARNTAPDLSSGGVVVGSNDLIGDGSDLDIHENTNAVLTNTLRGTAAHPLNPLLSPLANKGGPTATMAETALSPGIAHNINFPVLDANNGDITATDQRGVVRPQAGVDIGAFQLPPAGAATRLLIVPVITKLVAGHVLGTTTTPGGFVVKLVNAKGQIDTTNTSTVTITIDNATGVPIGNPVTAQATNGTASFSNLTPTVAGSFTLLATDAALTPGKSNKFTVTADADASTSQLVLTHQPANTVVGAPLATNLVVQIQDQFNNVVTTDHSKVTLSIFTGTGSLGGTTTVTASKGIATFSKATLNTAGTFTLSAADASLPTNNSVQFPQIVTQGITTVAAPHPAASYSANHPITLSTTFKSNAPTTIPFTGTASVVDQNNDVLGTASLSPNGTIKFTLNGVAANTYTCTIDYLGDANHTATTSAPFTLLVKP